MRCRPRRTGRSQKTPRTRAEAPPGSEGTYAGRSDVEPPAGNPPLSQIKLIPVDYEQVEKDAKSLKTRFNEIYQ
jgi:hypothetical protein